MGMVAFFAAIDQETANRLKSSPAEIGEYLYPDDGDDEPDNSIDIDKAWHGIHYMLTGTPYEGEPPLSWAIMGGEPVGDDVGYGPARFLSAEQIEMISKALPDTESFKGSYAPQEMESAEIYPDQIWMSEGEEALEYLVSNYEAMAAFYNTAASRGDGAILWVC